jgi:hypothetical protein
MFRNGIMERQRSALGDCMDKVSFRENAQHFIRAIAHNDSADAFG